MLVYRSCIALQNYSITNNSYVSPKEINELIADTVL